jgi:IS5 family transposase
VCVALRFAPGGAKGDIGVQAQGKPIVHSVAFSTAKDHDKTRMTALFHSDEPAIFGDSAYGHQEEKRGARHMDDLYYGIADRGARDHPLSSSQKKKNRKHAGIRAKIEHPFRVIIVNLNNG